MPRTVGSDMTDKDCAAVTGTHAGTEEEGGMRASYHPADSIHYHNCHNYHYHNYHYHHITHCISAPRDHHAHRILILRNYSAAVYADITECRTRDALCSRIVSHPRRNTVRSAATACVPASEDQFTFIPPHGIRCAEDIISREIKNFRKDRDLKKHQTAKNTRPQKGEIL